MADAANTVKTRGHQLTPWKPGQSGNPKGRPKGSRHKLEEVFLAELYRDFKEGGASAIKQCREEKPDVYLHVIAKVVPKQIDVSADDAVADFASGLQAVAEFLGNFAAQAGGADHEGPVPSGPVLSVGSRAQTH